MRREGRKEVQKGRHCSNPMKRANSLSNSLPYKRGPRLSQAFALSLLKPLNNLNKKVDPAACRGPLKEICPVYFCQARLQVPPDQRQNMQSSLQLLKMFVYSTSSRTSWMPERTSWRLLVINIFPPKKPRAAVTGSMATKKTLGLLASA